MKILRYSTILFLFISCEDIGKGYSWREKIPAGFSRNYGTIGYDYGWNATYSPFDEGIVIVGKQSPQINGQSDFWVIKTDSRGLLEWEKIFGGAGNEEGYDAIATSNGGFLLVGYTWSHGNKQQIYAIKTDFHGNTEWEKTYGGSMWEIGYAVIEVAGGGYVIAGFSNSPGISSGNTDMYLVKIDAQGEVVWEKSYGNQGFPNHEWAYDIIQTLDEGYIIVGARDRYSSGSVNALVLRTDKAGNIIWEKEFLDESQVSEAIYSISSSTDGAFYLCSSLNSIASPDIYQPRIIKIDGSGNIDWQRKFNSNSRKYHQFRATVTQWGEIVIVGSSAQQLATGHKEDAFMTKIDSKGNIIWTYPYGTADHDDWGWSVFETPKRNLVFVGSTKSFSASLFDIYLVGTNADGIAQ